MSLNLIVWKWRLGDLGHHLEEIKKKDDTIIFDPRYKITEFAQSHNIIIAIVILQYDKVLLIQGEIFHILRND